jgi:glyoxylase-like metal-dependent hydrolase (beta-lactamase superfamily II)
MPADPALHLGLSVFERGWLSSNNVLLGGEGDGAVLVDSGHCLHAAQTVQLVRHGLRGEPLAAVVNTHLHSDHCGGNAALQREFGARVRIPPGQWQAVVDWDEQALSYAATRQRCERFVPQGRVEPGGTLRVGRRAWQVLAAPGHDPHSVVLYDDANGVLISADALWENGFGIVFPELAGEPGFDDVAATLHLIAGLDARWVIPGHGAPFADVAGALARARARLAAMRADPARHTRYAAKVLLKYHLMEVRSQPLAPLRQWLADTPYLQHAWGRLGHPEGSLAAWGDALLAELAAGGALRVRDGVVHDAA